MFMLSHTGAQVYQSPTPPPDPGIGNPAIVIVSGYANSTERVVNYDLGALSLTSDLQLILSVVAFNNAPSAALTLAGGASLGSINNLTVDSQYQRLWRITGLDQATGRITVSGSVHTGFIHLIRITGAQQSGFQHHLADTQASNNSTGVTITPDLVDGEIALGFARKYDQSTNLTEIISGMDTHFAGYRKATTTESPAMTFSGATSTNKGAQVLVLGGD